MKFILLDCDLMLFLNLQNYNYQHPGWNYGHGYYGTQQ